MPDLPITSTTGAASEPGLTTSRASGGSRLFLVGVFVWLFATATGAAILWRETIFAEWQGHVVEDARPVEGSQSPGAILLRLRFESGEDRPEDAGDKWIADNANVESVDESEELTLRCQVVGEDQVTASTTAGRLLPDLFRMRVVLTSLFVLSSLCMGLAGTVYVRRDLSRWTTGAVKPALLGGFLLYGMAWIATARRVPLPDDLMIGFFVQIFGFLLTYAMIVIGLAVAWDVAQGKQSRLAISSRGIVQTIAFGAGAFGLLAVVGAMAIKLVALFVL